MHTPLHLLLHLLLELAEDALASDLALLLCQRQAQGLPEPHRGLHNKITPNSQIWALGDDAIPTLPYACSLNAMPSYYSVIQKAECDGSPSKQVTKCASVTQSQQPQKLPTFGTYIIVNGCECPKSNCNDNLWPGSTRHQQLATHIASNQPFDNYITLNTIKT